VVLPDHVKEWVPQKEFNYSGALGGWVCVADAAPANLKVEQADLRDIYWWAAGPTTNFGVKGLRSHSAELKGLILAQIVMRPQPGLRALVRRVSPRGPYVAIHLRSLEGHLMNNSLRARPSSHHILLRRKGAPRRRDRCREDDGVVPGAGVERLR
jgi:hypothetical protein